MRFYCQVIGRLKIAFFYELLLMNDTAFEINRNYLSILNICFETLDIHAKIDSDVYRRILEQIKVGPPWQGNTSEP
jgi:hypothetical protein